MTQYWNEEKIIEEIGLQSVVTKMDTFGTDSKGAFHVRTGHSDQSSCKENCSINHEFSCFINHMLGSGGF